MKRLALAFLLCAACGGSEMRASDASDLAFPCEPSFTFPPPPPRFCKTDADCHSDEQCGDPAVVLYTGVCVPKCIVQH